MSEHPTRYHVVTQLSEDTWVVRLARPTDEPNCDDLFLGASSLAPVVPDLPPTYEDGLRALASTMRKILPPALMAEVLSYLDPLTPFLSHVRGFAGEAARDRVAPPSGAQKDEER